MCLIHILYVLLLFFLCVNLEKKKQSFFFFKKKAKFTGKHLSWSLFFNKVVAWKPETARSKHWRCSINKGVPKGFANFTGKRLCWRLFVIKFQFWGPATLLNKTPTQIPSCENCKIFTNKFFEGHLLTTASKL